MYRVKFFAFVLLTLIASTLAQEKHTFTFNADNSLLISELTAIVQEKEGKVVFEMIPEQVMQQEKFKDLDLKKGDEILFINGKKVKTLSDLRETYEVIEPGQEIKLGIKRDKEQFFATIIREEQASGGKQMMIMSGGDSESTGGKVMMDGKEVNLDSLKKAGNVLVVPKKKKKGN